MLEDFSLFADLMCLNNGLGLFERMVDEKESLVAASIALFLLVSCLCAALMVTYLSLRRGRSGDAACSDILILRCMIRS